MLHAISFNHGAASRSNTESEISLMLQTYAKTYILFDLSCHILLSFNNPFACSLSRTGVNQKGFVAPPSKCAICERSGNVAMLPVCVRNSLMSDAAKQSALHGNDAAKGNTERKSCHVREHRGFTYLVVD